MVKRTSALGLIVLCLMPTLVPSERACAQWTSDVHQNLAVAAAQGLQWLPAMVSDGNGGAIVSWADARSGSFDIFASRVDRSGVRLWATSGTVVCIDPGHQDKVSLLADGQGGAFVAWVDGPSGDVHAQHVTSAGTATWAPNGVSLATTNVAMGQFPVMVSDSAGGAIAVWTEQVNYNTWHLRAQHVNSSGVPSWGPEGVLVSGSAMQSDPVAAPDGSGGIIVAWTDGRDTVHVGRDLYAQHINSAGSILWAENGLPLSTTNDGVSYPAILEDGAGGAFIAWTGMPATCPLCWPPDPFGLFVQRVQGDGELLWPQGGANLGLGVPGTIRLVSDGASGVIVAWATWTSSATPLMAQRLNALGEELWDPQGVGVASHCYSAAGVVADGAGGAVLAWSDARTPDTYAVDVYAQRLDADGRALWDSSGVTLTTANLMQMNPKLVSDGGGGAIAVWDDFRGSLWYPSERDIFAQRVSGDGVPGDSWPPMVPDTGAVVRSEPGRPYPNPTNGPTSIRFVLSRDSRARLSIHDVTGRSIRVAESGLLGAGDHTMAWDGRDARGVRVHAGVYLARLTTGETTTTFRLAVTP